MHQYMTRHMVALKDIVYAEWPVRTGEVFSVTPDDAEYLARVGKARMVNGDAVPQQEPEPEGDEPAPINNTHPQPPVKRGRGRPRKNP
jgi:hypothetical protein